MESALRAGSIVTCGRESPQQNLHGVQGPPSKASGGESANAARVCLVIARYADRSLLARGLAIARDASNFRALSFGA